MNADPVNELHTNQQSAKEGWNEEPEGDFISSKAMNWFKQFWKPARNLATTFHKPTQEENSYVQFEYVP